MNKELKMKIENTALISTDVDYYQLKAFSKSFLSKFHISPAHAFAQYGTKALNEGRMFHELCLEPDIFSQHYAVTSLSLATKEGKAFKEKNIGKEIIKKKDLTNYFSIRDRLYNFPFYFDTHSMSMGEIIKNSIVEQGIIADVKLAEIAGLVQVKIKPDYVYEKENDVFCFDLKTIDSASKQLKWDFQKYKYDWQSALYSHVLQAHYKKPVRFIFVMCEKSPPYGVKYVEIVEDTSPLSDIEETIYRYHEWELRGGDTDECYLPTINKVYIWRDNESRKINKRNKD